MIHRIVFLCILVLLSFSAQSQNKWLRSFGGQSHDEALAMIQSADGNVLVTGYFTNAAEFDNITLSAAGFSDIFLMKTTPLGQVLWAKRFGGTMPDRAYDVCTDAQNNIYLTGYFTGTADFGNFTLTSTGLQDIFVAKLDAQGDVLWVEQLGGNGNETAYGVAVDPSGNVIITGQFQGTATFGANTYTSLTDPNTGIQGYDIFIAKLDSSGAVLWSKHGAAPYDDRGLKAATTADGSIYITGQFSDTLHFTGQYNNTVYNAGFLLKLDPNGNEVWLNRLSAVQTLIYAIKAHSNTEIFIGGDFKGNMGVFAIPSNQLLGNLSTGFPNSIFIAKFNEAGQMQWIEGDGSDNKVSATAIDTDANGDVYQAGTFECHFTEYSDLYGPAAFYSAGFRDIFINKYSSTGQRQWVKHYGGPKDDYTSAIAVVGVDDPMIAGSYSKLFSIVSTNNIQGSGYTVPCAWNTFYNSVSSVSGFKDVFVTRPVELSAYPFTYYENTACVYDTLALCVNFCQDTIGVCQGNSAQLFSNTFTNQFGPEYEYLWSDGSTTYDISVSTQGNYSVAVNREDNCSSNNDSIYFQVYPVPISPLISDNQSVNFYQPPLTTPIEICGDTIVLTGHVNDTTIVSYAWSSFPSGVSSVDSIAYATNSGDYWFTQTNQYGCSGANQIRLKIDNFALVDTLQPHLVFLDSIWQTTDTVTLCEGDSFEMLVIDSLFFAVNGHDIPNKTVYWSTSAGLALDEPSTETFHKNIFYTNTSGYYTVYAHLENLCNPDTIDYFLERTFYVHINPRPYAGVINLIGSNQICPGDTSQIIVQSTFPPTSVSSQGVVWTSPTNDTLLVVNSGHYYAQVVVTDSITGCRDSVSGLLVILPKPNLPITVFPSNGIICPYDSLLLQAPAALAYVWIGPDGSILGNTQNIHAHVPGFYHCIITDLDGCTQESNFVELKEYNSPYIMANPGTVICAGGTVQLEVISSNGTNIQWLPPLTGSSSTVYVNQPGIYTAYASLCGITDTLNIEIIPSNTSAIITSSAGNYMCPGDTLLLYANSGMAGYEWSPGNISSTVYEVTQPGIYHLQTTDAYGCYGGDTIHILSHPPVDDPHISDTIICAGTNLTLNALSTDSVIWYASLNGATPIATGNTFNVGIVNSDTTFYVQADNGFCRGERVKVEVTVSPASLPVTILGNTIYCEGDSISLSAQGSTYATYTWSDTSGIIQLNSQSVSFAPAQTIMSGTYYITISDTYCGSTSDSVNIVVHPKPLIGIGATGTSVCASDSVQLYSAYSASSYFWTGNQTDSAIYVHQAGTYYLTVSNGHCSSTDSIVISSYSSQPLSLSFTNITVCPGSMVEIMASGNGVVTWFADNGTTILHTGDTLTVGPIHSVDTLFYAQLTDTNGCLSALTPITVYTDSILASPSIVPLFPYACEGMPYVFAPHPSYPAYTYEWITPGGQSILADTLVLIHVTTADSGVYQLVIHSGICSSDTAVYTLTVNPMPANPTQITSSVQVCEGEPFLLEDNSGLTVYWISPDFIYYQGSPLQIPSADSSHQGIWYYLATDGICMTDTIPVNVDVLPIPDSPVISGATTICPGDNLNLSVSNALVGQVYEWYDGQILLSNTSSLQLTGLTQPMQIELIVTGANGCSILVQLPITIMGTGSITLMANTDVCAGDDIYLESSDTTASNTYLITGSNGFSSNSPVNTITGATFFNSGMYYLEVSGGQCTVYDSVYVTVHSIPQSISFADTTICQGDVITLAAISGYNYYWSTGVQSQQIQVSDSGVYYLFTYDQFGCYAVDSVEVFTISCNQLMPPNIFTPNGDGVNDNFYFDTEGIVSIHMQIFNRWGELIYEWKELDGKWNGTNLRQIPAPAGTYFFSAKAVGYRGDEQIYTGSILLQR